MRIAARDGIRAMFDLRLAVPESLLAPGEVAEADVRRANEEFGRGWVIEDAGRVVASGIADAGPAEGARIRMELTPAACSSAVWSVIDVDGSLPLGRFGTARLA